MKEWMNSIKEKLKCKAIFLFDLVQDTSKTRLLIPLVILFSVFMIVSSIFASSPLVKPVPSKIKVLFEPSSSTVIGETFPRIPILGIKDQFSIIMPNVEIRMVVTEVMIRYHYEKINCDYEHLQDRLWTYEFIRNLGPCTVTLKGNTAFTNDFGVAYFYNLTIAKGPEGLYCYNFQIGDFKNFINTEAQNIIVSPSIFDIRIQTPSPKYAKIHFPIIPQPVLKIFDKFGKPLQNRIIDVISWPYGDYEQPFPQLFDPDPDKFSLFSGSKSNLSDSNGICAFTNLTIIASTHLSVYIIFVSEGSNIFVPWQNRYPPSFDYSAIRIFMQPITLLYENIHKIQVINELPSSVMEGYSLSLQPILRVMDSKNYIPASGMMCFALLREFNKMKFTSGFIPTYYETDLKFLQKMITANYLCNEISNDCLNPLFSNNEGFVNFTELGFSTRGFILGNASKAGIQFICGTGKSDIFNITVNSSINSVEVTKNPDFIWLNPVHFYSYYYFTFSILLEDLKGLPVPGKSPLNVKLISEFSNEENSVNISVYNDFSQLYNNIPTNALGFATYDAFIRQMDVEFGEYIFQVTFDGTNSSFQNKVYLNISEQPNFCTLLNYNFSERIELILKDDEAFSIELAALNFSNQYYIAPSDIRFNFFYSDYFHIKGSFFLVDKQIIIYKASMKFKNSTIVLNEKQSNLQFNQLDFIGMPSGSYVVYISVQKREDDLINKEFMTFCTSKFPLLIHYQNSVSRVNIINYNFSDFSDNENRTIFPNDNKFNLYLQILDQNNSPLPFFKIRLNIQVYQYPLYYSFLFQINPTLLDNLFSILIKENISNENGTLENIIIATPEKYQGLYVISIEVNGISSVPFFVNNSYPITEIEIIEEKVNSRLNMWDTVKPIIVHVKGLNIQNIQNIPIIAFFDSNGTQNDFDFTDENDTNLIGNSQRLRLTNSTGYTEFNSLSLFAFNNQNISDKCISGHFKFVVATFQNIHMDSLSNCTFCINFQLLVIDVHSYNFELFTNLYFPIIIEFNLFNWPNSNYLQFPIEFSLRMISYKTLKINDISSFYLAKNILSNNFCQFIKFQNSSICSFQYFYISSQKTLRLKVFFHSLNWDFLEKRATFDLTPCYFSFCNYSTLSLYGLWAINPNIGLEFYDFFPAEIQVGKSIINYMQAMKGTPDSHVIYISISCNIYPASDLQMASRNITEIVEGVSTNDNLNSIYGNSNFQRSKINEMLSEDVTDRNGFASLIFQFLSGQTGYYVIGCFNNDDSLQVFYSNIFYLTNDVQSIKIENDSPIQIYAIFSNQEGLYNKLTINLPAPIMLTIHSSTFQANYQSNITVEMYSSLKTDNNEKSQLSTLIMLINVVFNGASSLLQSSTTLRTLGRIGNITQLNNSSYLLDNISFQIDNPGQYKILFECKGIVSNFSSPIDIIQINYRNFIEFLTFYSNYFFIFSTFIIIISNSIYLKIWSLIVGFGLIVFDSILFGNLSNGVLILIIGELILSIIGIWILVQSISYLTNKEYFFSDTKKNIFKEFTLNRIKILLNRGKNKNKNLNNKLKNTQFRNLVSQVRPLDQSSELEDSSNSNFDKYKSKKNNFKHYHNLWYARILSIINIFKPFNKIDAFYFPQIFITSILVSVFTLIYCIFQVFIIMESLSNAFLSYRNICLRLVFIWINGVITSCQKKYNYEILFFDLNDVFEIIYMFFNFLKDFIFTINISLIISNVLISIIFIFSFYSMASKFRKSVMKKRTQITNNTKITKIKNSRKIRKIKEESIKGKIEFCGLMIGNVTLSYIIVTVILTLILTIISSKFFWQFIWEIRSFLLFLIVPVLVQFIVSKILQFFIYVDEITILNRNLIQIYDIICTFTSIFDGFVSSFSRFIFGLLGLLIGIIRFDKRLLPSWIKIPLLEDEIAESFENVVCEFSIYNNPIFCTVSNSLNQEKFQTQFQSQSKLNFDFNANLNFNLNCTLIPKKRIILWKSYILLVLPSLICTEKGKLKA